MKNGHESVSVRQIDNGYLVDHTRESSAGYQCRTSFSKTEPKIKAAKVQMDGGATDTTGFNRFSSGREIDEAINGRPFK